jgi:hypothetical protein
MACRLEARDWRHAKDLVWKAFVRWVLFWPLLVFRPLDLIEPRHTLAVSWIDSDPPDEDLPEPTSAGSAAFPPPCGAFVRFRQAASLRQSGSCGEFVFRSDDVADWLTRRLVVNPERASEGEIQHWIATRDSRLTQPTDVPAIASRFEFIADEMVRMGYGDVRCRKCDAKIPHHALTYSDDDGEQMSWNFNRIRCPERHPLLLVATVHNKFF